MNRRFLLTLAALALALAWGRMPARADRLGGNFRGPGDIYKVAEDAQTSSTDTSSGESTGGTAPPGDGGASSGDSSTGGDSSSAGGESGGGESGGGESGGGESGGGESGGGESGGGESGGGSSSPESGGGSSSGGESGGGESGGESGGGSAPPPETGGSGSAPAVPGGGGGSSGIGGKRAGQDDKDKIWPFYFESAKEEYLLTLLSRRPDSRISPPKTSTYLLSTQPEPARARRFIGETDRQEAFALVLGLISDPDSHVRDAVVLALGKSGFKEALPHIQKIADSDPDFAVREDALLALGLSGQADAALPYLLKAMTGPSTDRREKRAAYAALGLGLLGQAEGAVEPLRKLYAASMGRTGAENEAACAAVALGMLGDAAAIPLFERAVTVRGTSEEVKCYTLHALSRYGQNPDEKIRKQALKAVISGLGGKAEVRASALLALGSFNDVGAIQALVKDGLNKADPYGKNYSAHSLGRIAGRLGPASREYGQIAKALGEIAENDKKDKWLFQAGTLALANMACGDHEKTLNDFAGDLKKLDQHVASVVVLSLGMLGTDSPETGKLLQGIYESRSSGTNVQAYAGLALAMSGNPIATAELTKALSADTKPAADVARSAALAIGLAGGADEAKMLVDVLTGKVASQSADSARFFLKGAAVQGLGIIGDAESIKALKPVLESKGWEERAFAAAALGYMMESKPENRIAPRLSGIFRHHNYHVSLPVVKAVQGSL